MLSLLSDGTNRGKSSRWHIKQVMCEAPSLQERRLSSPAIGPAGAGVERTRGSKLIRKLGGFRGMLPGKSFKLESACIGNFTNVKFL